VLSEDKEGRRPHATHERLVQHEERHDRSAGKQATEEPARDVAAVVGPWRQTLVARHVATGPRPPLVAEATRGILAGVKVADALPVTQMLRHGAHKRALCGDQPGQRGRGER